MGLFRAPLVPLHEPLCHSTKKNTADKVQVHVYSLSLSLFAGDHDMNLIGSDSKIYQRVFWGAHNMLARLPFLMRDYTGTGCWHNRQEWICKPLHYHLPVQLQSSNLPRQKLLKRARALGAYLYIYFVAEWRHKSKGLTRIHKLKQKEKEGRRSNARSCQYSPRPGWHSVRSSLLAGKFSLNQTVSFSFCFLSVTDDFALCFSCIVSNTE